ncbi:hypothetical protein [Streptomyces sp. NPDC005549]|uniref:hypothetical protein n=1 Tax=Streptomyces sp. NPDC005549 TaxID=3154888 RepID=UPI0033B205CE
MDWKWTATAVLPVISLVLGVALNQWADGRREAAALKREKELRRIDRDQARLDRRETFELTHLIELHEALSSLFTAALPLYEAVESGTPARPEASTALGAANREVYRNKGLVLDETSRHWTDSAHSYINDMTRGGSLDRALGALETAQTAIADRVREIYGPDMQRSSLQQ